MSEYLKCELNSELASSLSPVKAMLCGVLWVRSQGIPALSLADETCDANTRTFRRLSNRVHLSEVHATARLRRLRATYLTFHDSSTFPLKGGLAEQRDYRHYLGTASRSTCSRWSRSV